jgi:hypothetical protein
LRETAVRKTALPRGWLDLTVAGSQLPIKIAHRDGTIWQVTPEFEDLDRAAAAQGMSPLSLLLEGGHGDRGCGRVGDRRPGARRAAQQPELAS